MKGSVALLLLRSIRFAQTLVQPLALGLQTFSEQVGVQEWHLAARPTNDVVDGIGRRLRLADRSLLRAQEISTS